MQKTVSLSSSPVWNSVGDVQIQPDVSQTLISNGYNMVRVNVWFTPTYSTNPSDPSISGTPVTVPQSDLNNAVRLVNYDTGKEVLFLTTPPTPDHPLGSNEFNQFTGWAQTQTPNEFLTEGAGAVLDTAAESCVVFYVLCNAINPNPSSLKLGVQITPTCGSPIKYWKSGASGLGDNGAKTIAQNSPTQYKLDDFLVTANNNRHQDGYDDNYCAHGGMGRLWRQYDFSISISGYAGAIKSRSDYPPTTPWVGSTIYVPRAIGISQGGYCTDIYNWPDNFGTGPYYVTNFGFSDNISVTIPDVKTSIDGWVKCVRVSAIFKSMYANTVSAAYIQPIPITIWDEAGNNGTIYLNDDLKTYTEIDASYNSNTPSWSPITDSGPGTTYENTKYSGCCVNGLSGTMLASTFARGANITVESTVNSIAINRYTWGIIPAISIEFACYIVLPNGTNGFRLYEDNTYQADISGYSVSVTDDHRPYSNYQYAWYMYPAWSKNGYYLCNADTGHLLTVSGSSTVFADPKSDTVFARKNSDTANTAYLWYLLDNPAPSYPGWGPSTGASA